MKFFYKNDSFEFVTFEDPTHLDEYKHDNYLLRPIVPGKFNIPTLCDSYYLDGIPTPTSLSKHSLRFVSTYKALEFLGIRIEVFDSKDRLKIFYSQPNIVSMVDQFVDLQYTDPIHYDTFSLILNFKDNHKFGMKAFQQLQADSKLISHTEGDMEIVLFCGDAKNPYAFVAKALSVACLRTNVDL